MESKKKIVSVVGAVIATAIVASIVGFLVYMNSAPVRLNKQLELGRKYVTEQDYEQAIVFFQAAIEIDPRSTEAYLGMAEVYIHLGDNKNAIDILMQGYEATDYDGEIKAMLVAVYLDMAKSCADILDYEKALEYYNILLELDRENGQVLNDLEMCLMDYLEILMDDGRYEEIRQLMEMYGRIVTNVDFQKYILKIEEIEKIEAENTALMQKLFELMQTKSYEEIQTLETSEEMQMFFERMEEDRYIYIPKDDGTMTGTGAGVYCLSADVRLFFYGEYESGIRSGEGTTYNTNDFGGYSEFVGEWKEDAPNGQGTLFFQRFWSGTGEAYQEFFSGNLVEGLFDGPMSNQTIMNGIVYDMSCNATMGIPEDRTEEMARHVPYVTQIVPAESYIYAFDNPGGQWYFALIGNGETMGVLGYRNT